ncbi:hypothetical protein LMG28688_05130 [Paraburkholderia caffeinitolerans]|uniref:Lipid A biosynthesis lauroyltransferase n=1 Tax=Paraburkholderia caffeinitolerans TaxID=1723730 RepID=A0A6J5GK05_9BURK|nr:MULTISPECIES: hypothetical protein [Paraburkholderia]CAB3800378.1 hypothetical protein LMG28688_05130 [Paraburkholderia caffeinitolerans]
MSVGTLSQYFKHFCARLARGRVVLRRQLLARLPFIAVERAALANWMVKSAFDGGIRANGVSRYETGRIDIGLGRPHALRTMSANVREAWLDERIYAGRALRRDAWPDLRAVAQQLALRINQIRTKEPGRVVVLSPFHYVSQYANIWVVDEVRRLLGMESMAVVSGVQRDMYGNDAAMIPSIRVLYTYDENGRESRNGLGLRVIRALRRDGVAVVFSDVPPYTLAKFPMETVGVTIGGRPARVHNGVFRIGTPVDALLLPFYLSFEKGRFGVRMFDPIALADTHAPQHLANDIEIARRENYPHWLYAGHPSVYHFAAAR